VFWWGNGLNKRATHVSKWFLVLDLRKKNTIECFRSDESKGDGIVLWSNNHIDGRINNEGIFLIFSYCYIDFGFNRGTMSHHA